MWIIILYWMQTTGKDSSQSEHYSFFFQAIKDLIVDLEFVNTDDVQEINAKILELEKRIDGLEREMSASAGNSSKFASGYLGDALKAKAAARCEEELKDVNKKKSTEPKTKKSKKVEKATKNIKTTKTPKTEKTSKKSETAKAKKKPSQGEKNTDLVAKSSETKKPKKVSKKPK